MTRDPTGGVDDASGRAPAPSASIPFYPHHWRLFTGIVAATLAWVAVLYLPPALTRQRALEAERERLDTPGVSDADLAARWAAVRRRREAGASLPSEPALLLALQGAARTTGVDLVDLRPATDSTGPTWTLRARAPYAGALAFLGLLEAPPTSVRVERIRLSAPDTAAATLHLDAVLRAPIPR